MIHRLKSLIILAQDNSSTTVEIRMRHPYAQWRYRMDVFADGKRVYFDRPALRVQHFRGIKIFSILFQHYY